jgi:FixJ family two-component response regulator
MLTGVRRVLDRAGYQVSAFGSGREFVRSPHPEPPSCVLLDVDMPEVSGLDVQRQLLDRGEDTPIVFMTGLRDVPAVIQALKGGAVDFLLKPFTDAALLEAVERAVQRSVALDRKRREAAAAQERLAALTVREREVCLLVGDGFTSGEIAGRLGTAESTISLHRAHIMSKLHAASVADVVRLIDLVIPRGADEQSWSAPRGH